MYLKSIFTVCLITFALCSNCSVSAAEDSIKVLTFNIRVKGANDPGDRNYSKRKPLIENIIRGTVMPEKLKNLDFIVFQEDDWGGESPVPLANYASIIPSPETSNLRILYDKNKWKLLDQGQTTMSAIDRGPRYFQYAKFIHNGRLIYIFNYHGFITGQSQTEFNKIISKLKEAMLQNIPVIFMGDFNPSGPALIDQLLRPNENAPIAVPKPLNAITGECTFNDWNANLPQGTCPGQYDYIFSSPDLERVSHAVIKTGAPLPSDHYPVYEELKFK